MDDVNLDNERGHHWRKVIEDNDGGVDDAKALLHANRWDVYVNEKGKLVKGRYSVEFLVITWKRLFGECLMIMS